MPTVSVVIPTYNHRGFVVESLESVFAQTFTDYEVIVVNDGSPDDTADVLRPYVQSGRIRYFEQPNAGQAAARNRGIAEARGEFIALLDDDDHWPPDKLEWQLAHLRANVDLAGVAGTADVVDEQGRLLRRTACAGMITFEKLFQASQMVSPGQCLFRSECVRAVGGFDATIWGADDWDLYFRITRQWPIQMQDRVALCYRKHGGNASGNLARMLRNAADVIERNVVHARPERRGALRRSAYRFVYQYAGTKLFERVRGELAAGRPRPAMRDLAGMRALVPAMIRDPRLLLYSARDLLPSGLGEKLHRSSRRPVVAAPATECVP